MDNICIHHQVNNNIGGNAKAKTLLYLFMKYQNSQSSSATIASVKKYNAIPNDMAPVHIAQEFGEGDFFEYHESKATKFKTQYSNKDRIELTPVALQFMEELRDFCQLVCGLQPKDLMRKIVAVLSIPDMLVPLEILYRDPLSRGNTGYSMLHFCDYTDLAKTTIGKRLVLLRGFASSVLWDGRIQWFPEKVLSQKLTMSLFSQKGVDYPLLNYHKKNKAFYYRITDLGCELMKVLDGYFLPAEYGESVQQSLFSQQGSEESLFSPQENVDLDKEGKESIQQNEISCSMVDSASLLRFLLDQEIDYIDVTNFYEYAESFGVARDDFIYTLKQMAKEGYVHAKTHAYFVPWTIKYLLPKNVSLEQEFLAKQEFVYQLFNSLDVYYVLKTLHEHTSEQLSSNDKVEISSQAVYMLSLDDKELIEQLQDLQIQGIIHLFKEKDGDGNMWGKCLFTIIGEQVFSQYDQIV